VIRLIDSAVAVPPTLAVLRGNLAPSGAVLKVAAASSRLLKHSGPALVFDNYEDMLTRIDDPDLDVTAETVLVLRNAGPRGACGMPEWGMLPIPKKLQAAGVRDMVRMSDARMSGTSFGTVVLHIAPEAAVGGASRAGTDGRSHHTRRRGTRGFAGSHHRRTGAPRQILDPTRHRPSARISETLP